MASMEGLVSSENHKTTRWKSSLLWYFLTDLGLELKGQITLPKVLYRTARHLGDKAAILQKKSGHFQPTRFSELLKNAEHFAAALVHLGLQPGDRVALLLRNSLEWVITDFGTMDAGGITVPLYYTLATPVIAEILKDSGASILVVDSREKMKKVLAIREQCPALKHVILAEDSPLEAANEETVNFREALKLGEEKWVQYGEEISRRRENASYHDVATIIYTSGTTGEPKGVMLTHRNILSNVLGVLSVSEVNENDVVLSILPLAHAFERTVGYYLPILTGASIAFAEGYDTLIFNLKEIRPTFCAAVPRIFEKIYESTLRNLKEGNALKRALFEWALRVGTQVIQHKAAQLALRHPDRRVRHRPEDRNNHVEPRIKSLGLRLKWKLAHFLVYGRFKKLLGGRLRYFVSGGAPLRAEICQFFKKIDIHIYEGYGLTEASPVIAFNYRNKFHPGTVGKLLPWIQLKFDIDGEICVKGPNLMKGYYHNPKADAEVFDADGWFRTGDIGYLDENHFLHITDRKKELIVMSNGKKVAPLAVEGLLVASPLVSQAVVMGNNRKFITALLVPNIAELESFAKQREIPFNNPRQLLQIPAVNELFIKLVAEVNENLSNFEQIKRFKLLKDEFTQEAGEVTPTLKIKRKVVEQKYDWMIEEMYGEQTPLLASNTG